MFLEVYSPQGAVSEQDLHPRARRLPCPTLASDCVQTPEPADEDPQRHRSSLSDSGPTLTRFLSTLNVKRRFGQPLLTDQISL